MEDFNIKKHLLIESSSIWIIKSFLGNLTPRHKEVFLRNPLFVGMRLPEVREISPLEKKFTRISPQSLELMKVCIDNKHHLTMQPASGAGLFSS